MPKVKRDSRNNSETGFHVMKTYAVTSDQNNPLDSFHEGSRSKKKYFFRIILKTPLNVEFWAQLFKTKDVVS